MCVYGAVHLCKRYSPDNSATMKWKMPFRKLKIHSTPVVKLKCVCLCANGALSNRKYHFNLFIYAGFTCNAN